MRSRRRLRTSLSAPDEAGRRMIGMGWDGCFRGKLSSPMPCWMVSALTLSCPRKQRRSEHRSHNQIDTEEQQTREEPSAERDW